MYPVDRGGNVKLQSANLGRVRFEGTESAEVATSGEIGNR
jgi:hypothetical protein